MPRGSRAQLERFAHGIAANLSPVEAAKAAGYPPGTSMVANAKKRAQRADVKELVATLRAPHLQKVSDAIGVSVEWATKHLKEVADLALPGEPSVGDGLRAIDLASKLHGWIPQGGDDDDSKTPTVIKFQLNIFDNARQEAAKIIEHEAPKVVPSP